MDTLFKWVFGIIIAFFVLLIIAGLVQKSKDSTVVDTNPVMYYVPSPTPYIDNRVTQYYWYCWDNGDPQPHHFGHYVYGDHLCTNGELRR